MIRKALLPVILLICLSTNAYALSLAKENLWTNPLTYILISAVILALGSIIVLQTSIGLGPTQKKMIFWILVGPVIAATLFMAIHTLYENTISETGGPVHWHMDYQVWACGERLDLVNPRGLNNKIGTPVLHEHNDDRIHVEGTLLKFSEASLGKFFNVIGGELTDSSLSYPVVEKGILSYKNGDLCGDGTQGTLKVYVNGKKIDDPASYVMAPYTLVPPGDCAIILFDNTNSDTISELCESWEAKDWDYSNFEQKRGGK